MKIEKLYIIRLYILPERVRVTLCLAEKYVLVQT